MHPETQPHKKTQIMKTKHTLAILTIAFTLLATANGQQYTSVSNSSTTNVRQQSTASVNLPLLQQMCQKEKKEPYHTMLQNIVVRINGGTAEVNLQHCNTMLTGLRQSHFTDDAAALEGAMIRIGIPVSGGSVTSSGGHDHADKNCFPPSKATELADAPCPSVLSDGTTCGMLPSEHIWVLQPDGSFYKHCPNKIAIVDGDKKILCKDLIQVKNAAGQIIDLRYHRVCVDGPPATLSPPSTGGGGWIQKSEPPPSGYTPPPALRHPTPSAKAPRDVSPTPSGKEYKKVTPSAKNPPDNPLINPNQKGSKESGGAGTETKPVLRGQKIMLPPETEGRVNT